MIVKGLLLVLIAVLSVAYPILVYLGVDRLSPTFFACVIAGLSIARMVVTREYRAMSQWLLLMTILGFAAYLHLSSSVTGLLFYPVLMSFLFAGLFISSIFSEQSIIERFARLAGKTITPTAKLYTRRLTGVWGVLLVINGIAAALLALYASMDVWTFYCGFLSYAIFVLVFIAEFFYRKHFIRKYGA